MICSKNVKYVQKSSIKLPRFSFVVNVSNLMSSGDLKAFSESYEVLKLIDCFHNGAFNLTVYLFDMWTSFFILHLKSSEDYKVTYYITSVFRKITQKLTKHSLRQFWVVNALTGFRLLKTVELMWSKNLFVASQTKILMFNTNRSFCRFAEEILIFLT